MTLSVPASQPLTMSPFLPTHMSLPPNYLSHILQPFPGHVPNIFPNNCTTDNGSTSPSQTTPHPSHYLAESPLTTNSSRDILGSEAKRLEHHLHSALTIVVKAFGISSSAKIFTPQAHNTLKALNALVPVEPSPQKTTASDPPARSKSVGREVTRWLRTSRSPK